MKLPEYVTKEEVRRVCKELKLSDWTKIKAPKISLKEGRSSSSRSTMPG
jgi:hypothetical protein